MAQKQGQPRVIGKGADYNAYHRVHSTDRDSAGSTSPNTPADEADPALPRSVLCTAEAFQFYIFSRLFLPSPAWVYILHLDGVRHQEVVDSIEILSVEKADFDLPSSIRRLKDLHLCAQCPSQLRLSSFDVRVHGLWG